ncbi:MAG: nicotinate-nucleotide--dimethylbenzimidazole phosphoribosyltransferase [Lentisphaeria bacterium]|nr:nicotinate-nucleotide--dimethylbenzimidazole phosphoribosyltransferase [Lentisphaeria bacterium]
MGLLQQTLERIAPPSEIWREKARQYILTLTMPPWALGRLLDLATDLAAIGETLQPCVARKNIILMAGDHGIAAEGVSPTPKEVTRQMIANFISGGAGVSVLARQAGTEVTIVDIGVDADLSAYGDRILHRKIRRGTADFACGPAMSREEAVRSIETGIEITAMLAGRTDVFGTGDMGIANTSPSSAILSVLTGEPLENAVGMGAGLTPDRIREKIEVIRRGIELNRPDPDDALDVLAKVGGLEIGGIAGTILGAAALHKPVVVDGFISTAGAMIAANLCPACIPYMILAHRSAEPGHRAMTAKLGREPLLDLGMRLGEGSGAAAAMPLLDSAAAILREMATFQSAAVTGEGDYRK